MSEPSFLYGGSAGVRDQGGLEAAVEQPKHTFFYGHGDLLDIAATYAFPIAQAQACVDGNKRTGVAATLVSEFDPWEIYRLVMAIAEHRATKADIADFLRKASASS